MNNFQTTLNIVGLIRQFFLWYKYSLATPHLFYFNFFTSELFTTVYDDEKNYCRKS